MIEYQSEGEVKKKNIIPQEKEERSIYIQTSILNNIRNLVMYQKLFNQD